MVPGPNHWRSLSQEPSGHQEIDWLLGQRKVVLQCARRDGRATLGRRRSMDKKRRLFPAARTAPVRLLPGDNRLSLTRNCGKNRADYKSLSHTTNL